MTTEQSSSESASRKRPRRSKQDPQFIFDNSTTTDTEMDTSTNKRSPQKIKSKPLRSIDSADASADLYEPGDIVWCKLGGFPWWPALVYRCNAEGGIHTKTLNSNNKPKRQFFVYFYGKYLEYSWISTRWLLKYAGLSSFIQHAEAAVQQASTKSEQQELANRFQLKVSMKKRVQWDEAIELADHALTMTNAERIKEFSDLLNDALDNKNQSKNSVRRRKSSLDKSEEEEGAVEVNKRRARDSSESSVSSPLEATIDETNIAEKSSISLRKPITFAQNGTSSSVGDEQVGKKKRGRKPKSETNNNVSDLTINDNQPMKTRTSRLSANKDRDSSPKPTRTSRRSAVTNGNEIEYDYQPSNRLDQQTSLPLVHLIQTNNPPLSNYEQKQIVEGLLHHPKEKSLTFDEAQTYAIQKAMEIVYENHNYRMNNIASEWFYDSILLKYPSVVFKYRSWFENIKIDVVPNGTDMITLKQWQIGLMLHAQIKAEQQQQQQTSSNEN